MLFTIRSSKCELQRVFTTQNTSKVTGRILNIFFSQRYKARSLSGLTKRFWSEKITWKLSTMRNSGSSSIESFLAAILP